MARNQDKHGKDYFLPGYELCGLEVPANILTPKDSLWEAKSSAARTSATAYLHPIKSSIKDGLSVNNERGCGWEGSFLSKTVVAHFPQQPSDACGHEIHKTADTKAPQAGATESCAQECRLPNQVTPLYCGDYTDHWLPSLLRRWSQGIRTGTKCELTFSDKNSVTY